MTDKELKDWLTGFALCAYITPHPIPQREPVEPVAEVETDAPIPIYE